MVEYTPRGTDIASRILAKNTPYLVYGDPDIDGAVSEELTERVLRAYQKPYQIYINENRRHGFHISHEDTLKLRGYTIILVDAGMTREELVYLTDLGINVINIDHHHLAYDELVHVISPQTGAEGVIINNQYPFEPEDKRFLSGAGVVYFVFKSMFPTLYGKDEIALVGLTLLSDIRPLDDELARQFLYFTYNHKSDYMQYLINVTKPQKDYGFGTQTFDRNYIDFTFSPRINALFRLNRGYEALQVFRGDYISTGQLDVFRGIQKAISDHIVVSLQGDDRSNLAFKFVDSNLQLPYPGYEITNFVGLACSQVKNSGKTSVIFIRENGKIKRGSLRGLCNDVDYLGILRRHGFKAEGHPYACGVTEVDLATVDLDALNAEIAQAEEGYEQRKYANRIIYVENLAFFLNNQADKIAEHNNYVRDNQRYYIKYTGKNATSFEKGKAKEFNIDGVKVIGFSHSLTLENDLILPVKERGSYINFYLQPY